jgi:HNH endonuclease
MDFVFDEKGKRNRFTRAEMIEDLKRFAKRRRGRAFTMAEFDAWGGGRCAAATIRARFGECWRRAQWAAGIASARRGKYSPEELMRILEEVWREVERPPGSPTLRRVARMYANGYVRHWGSLKAARERLARFHRGEITREELLAPVAGRRVRRELSKRTRWLVHERDGHRCCKCGRSPKTDPGVVLEVDHIVPCARGGGNEMENLRTLCRDCNRGKRVDAD